LLFFCFQEGCLYASISIMKCKVQKYVCHLLNLNTIFTEWFIYQLFTWQS